MTLRYMAARLYPGYPAKFNAPQTHVRRIACSVRSSSVDVRCSVIQFARDDQALVQSSLSTIKLVKVRCSTSRRTLKL